MQNTVCQQITAALLPPHKSLTFSGLMRETGASGDALLPVVNRMIGMGLLVVRGNRVERATFLEAEGF
jgi:hypothetical protein